MNPKVYKLILNELEEIRLLAIKREKALQLTTNALKEIAYNTSSRSSASVISAIVIAVSTLEKLKRL